MHAEADTPSGISVAAYNVGCFFGAVLTIWIGDMLGRRKTIFVGSAIMVVGAALQASASSLPHFITGRLITGYVVSWIDVWSVLTFVISFGNGLNTSTVPTWQSECSKSHKRGQMVMVEVCGTPSGRGRLHRWLTV